MPKNTPSTGSQVRAWAAAQGLTKAGRGRLSSETVKAFNAAHPKAKYSVGYKGEPTRVTVSAKRDGASTVRGQISIPEARSVLTSAGIAVGERGRLSQAQLAQAILARSEQRKAGKTVSLSQPEAPAEA